MRPASRDGFAVAVICALSLEADPVEALFDETYDRFGSFYGKQPGDTNTYLTGRINRHNVVLCYLPGIGKGSAAAAAANLRLSYTCIQLALVVGVCGGVPFSSTGTEIILGDVIIGDRVIEYDFGRQYPDRFRQKSEPQRPIPEIRSFLSGLKSRITQGDLETHISQTLRTLQKQSNPAWQHPGIEHDVLFEASYRHKHYQQDQYKNCICNDCKSSADPVCEEALKGDCNSLGCAGWQVQRHRHTQGDTDPSVHIGTFASADTVMKSGKHRDEIAAKDMVIGFEMEGVGVWDNMPCVIIKGVCDYADSHKNKIWQGYAAAAAAAATKAFLEYWPLACLPNIDPTHVAAITRDQHSTAATPSLCGIAKPQSRLISVEQSLSPLDRQVRESLAFPEMFERRNNIEKAHNNTCGWILKLDEFTRWMETPRGFLWIKGKPGAGKSTLMAFMRKSLENKNDLEPAHTLEYFFSARGSELQRTPLGMLRSLLIQLCQQDGQTGLRLQQIYQKKCDAFGSDQRTWEWQQRELEAILHEEIVASSKRVPLMIFVDALDEAGSRSAQELVRYFHQIHDALKTSRASGKICISCRHYPALPTTSSIEVWVENHNQDDIATFVRDSLSICGLNTDPPDDQELESLKADLIASARGVFQWVRLVTPLVKQKFYDGESIEYIQHFLRQVPEELENIYEYILTNIIEKEYHREAFLLFQWVCLAESPLSVTEMRYAMSIRDSTDAPQRAHRRQASDLIKANEVMKKKIKSRSGGLIEVVREQNRYWGQAEKPTERVQVIHQSVNDFFMRRGLALLTQLQKRNEDASCGTIATDLDNGYIIKSCQGVLYRSCLNYMTTENILTIKDHQPEQISETWPFLRYATVNIFVHAEKAQDCRSGDIRREISRLQDIIPGWILSYKYLYRFSDSCPEYGTTLLHIGCASNLIDITNSLISENTLIDERDGMGNTGLHHAARSGHTRIGEVLLRNGAVVDAQNNSMVTPLVSAAGCGHIGFVSLLVKKGASTNMSTGETGSALQRAATSGNIEMVRILLEAKADVSAQGGHYGNALQAASWRGSKEVVQVLLDAQADVNAHGGYYGNALQAASWQGSKEVVQVLLDAQADVNAHGGYYGNALQAASWEGSKEVVQVLLDAQADVNAHGGYYGNALQAASSSGSKEVVQVLLDAQADVNAHGGYYGNALQAASSSRSKQVVEVLLDAQADVNAQGGRNGNPLQVLVCYGSTDILQLLLDCGADPSAPTSAGQTLAHTAARQGDLEVIQILGQYPGLLNTPDQFGRTPLHLAVYYGRVHLLVFLCKNQNKPLALDIYGRYPLDWASNNRAMLNLLQNHLPLLPPKQEEIRIRTLEKSVRQIAHGLLTTPRNWKALGVFELGRCLMFLEYSADATYILSQRINLAYQMDAGIKGIADCDICGIFVGAEPHFICKTCAQVEICFKCMKSYPRRDKLNFCYNHEFLEVLPWSQNGNANRTSSATDIQKWLKNILERFDNPERQAPERIDNPLVTVVVEDVDLDV